MRRRFGSVLVFALLLADCRPRAPTPSPGVDAVASEVVELDIAEAQRRMAAGTSSARALTQQYLERIAAIDDAGPRLAAVIEVSATALAEADALDRERAAGRLRGPLHGIPVVIKDNIDVAGMVNSAGSLALAEHRPREDAALVTRLRAAGAVILGKTNLSEWANLRGLRSTSGWSSRGGQTRNPYALDRNPCGSSSGTGSAIAASLATVGVGTETDGSILCPAAAQGLVGLKPTVGLISQRGIIPISATQDAAGPMARTVRDAALLLAAMVEDPGDEGRAGGPNYVEGLQTGALRGRRIGVLRQAMGQHAGVDAVTEQAIAALRAAGAEVVDPVEISTWGQWDGPELEVLLVEFKAGLDEYLRRSGAPLPSLAAVIAWNRDHAAAVLPWFGQEMLERAQATPGLDAPAYLAARAAARRLAWDEGLGATLERHRLAAVVAPAGGPAWLTDPLLGDHGVHGGYSVAAVAGTPSLTVPMGALHGLPLGLVFMGRPGAEAELLALGYAFEQATRARRAPDYRRSTSAP